MSDDSGFGSIIQLKYNVDSRKLGSLDFLIQRIVVGVIEFNFVNSAIRKDQLVLKFVWAESKISRNKDSIRHHLDDSATNSRENKQKKRDSNQGKKNQHPIRSHNRGGEVFYIVEEKAERKKKNNIQNHLGQKKQFGIESFFQGKNLTFFDTESSAIRSCKAGSFKMIRKKALIVKKRPK